MNYFQHPSWLYALVLIVPLIGYWIYYHRWVQQKIVGFPLSIRSFIFPNYQRKIAILKTILWTLAIIFLIIGIANPRKGVKEEKIKSKGIDIMLLLDVSNSMLAADIQPNRLERAKLLISKLMNQMGSNRVGLVMFAGNAFLQVPPTIDHGAIKLSLPYMQPSAISSQGTSIGEAVDIAVESLGTSNTKNKAIIVFTDGEDNEGEAEAAIERAKKVGITTLAVGVGLEEGAPIPMNGDYKRDENGEIVKTAFNRNILENLASIGNGAFYHLGQQGDITADILSKLNSIEKKEYEELDFTSYHSYFYIFLIIALILIFIEFMLPTAGFKSWRVAAIVFVLFSIVQSADGQSNDTAQTQKEAIKLTRSGNTSYNQGKFSDAETKYRKAAILAPKNSTIQYNLSNSLYSQNKHKEAIEGYQKAAKSERSTNLKSMAYHNLGNAHYKSGDMEKAIESYKNALKLNPNDMDTKINLAMAKKKQKNKGGGAKQNQPQNGQNQSQDQKDGHKGEQPKPDDKGEKKDQNNNGQNQPEPKSGEMSKEDAEKLLEALKNQEQNTQNKVNMNKKETKPKKFEKDW